MQDWGALLTCSRAGVWNQGETLTEVRYTKDPAPPIHSPEPSLGMGTQVGGREGPAPT